VIFKEYTKRTVLLKYLKI